MLGFKTLREGRGEGGAEAVSSQSVRQVMLLISSTNRKMLCPATVPVCLLTVSRWGIQLRYFILLLHFANGNVLGTAAVSLGHFGKQGGHEGKMRKMPAFM